MKTHKLLFFKFLAVLLILTFVGSSWGNALAAGQFREVSTSAHLTFQKNADVWLGRAGVYFSSSVYTGTVMLTRQDVTKADKPANRLARQGLVPLYRYLDFQLNNFAGNKVSRLFGLVYVYFNLYPADRALWEKGQLAIYYYDTTNEKWVECIANHLIRDHNYRLACVASETGLYALVKTTK